MTTKGLVPSDFATRLLAWFDRHGRHDLPWQQPRSPYRVWLSEIMLQQTRVETVIPYFEKFTTAFPDILSLAQAPPDAVLHLWTGLGYYARARNLHQAARIIVERHDGELPTDLDALIALPGIGRSTAGAIVAMAWGRRAPILDGNVKRTLARHGAIAGWPGESAVARQLWTLADRYTPTERVADYTQAIMDLGATLCTRARPDCARCPVADDCQSRRADAVSRFPGPKPATANPVRMRLWLVLRNVRGEVLLERRPPSGVWGGLWSFPECAPDIGDAEIEATCAGLGCQMGAVRQGASGRHLFTHFKLDYRTLEVMVSATEGIADGDRYRWVDPAAPGALGLPAPVHRLLQELTLADQPARPPQAVTL